MDKLTSYIGFIFPPENTDIEEISNTLIKEYLGGYKNPLEAKILIKKLETLVKLLKDSKDLNNSILQEAELYGEKSFDLHGCTFNTRNNSKINYCVCKDENLNKLLIKETELKNTIKNRKEFLKSIKEKTSIVDEETGEIKEVYPAHKSTETIVAITIKKQK